MRIKYPKKLEKFLLKIFKSEYSYRDSKNIYLCIDKISYDLDFCTIECRCGIYNMENQEQNQDYKFEFLLNYNFSREFLKGMFIEKILQNEVSQGEIYEQ